MMSKSAVNLTSSAAVRPGRVGTEQHAQHHRPGRHPRERGHVRPRKTCAAVVAHRLVALAHRFAEAVFNCVRPRRHALRGMPGDAVEHRAHHPAGRHALLQQRGVAGQLGHDELIDGHGGDPSDEALGALIEVLRLGRLDGQAPFGGLRAGDAIPGEQKTFGALIPQPVRPQARGRNAPAPAWAGSRSSRRTAAITWSACSAMSVPPATQ